MEISVHALICTLSELFAQVLENDIESQVGKMEEVTLLGFFDSWPKFSIALPKRPPPN